MSEIHASLVNLIAADQSRVFGSTGSSSLPVLRADGAGDAEEKDEPEENGPVATEGAEEEPEGLEYDAELDALVRRGIAYAKRWDRSAKLKSADGRAGWERHVIGALCQVSLVLGIHDGEVADLLDYTAWWSSRHAQPHSHPRPPVRRRRPLTASTQHPSYACH